jgi:peptidoglycan/LPS O-acetylase OafA/YrhL
MGAIRLFLALVVVFDHLRLFVLQKHGLDVNVAFALGFNAGYAVMFFYVISGFLISFALSHKYGPTADGVRRFYENRFIRIFSAYWPMAIIILVLSSRVRADFVQAGSIDQLTGMLIFGMSSSIAFTDYPALHWSAAIPTLLQAWTLDAELSFYLVAPFLLRSRIAMVAVLVISAVIRAVLVSKYGFNTSWTYLFVPSTLLFFLLGGLSRFLAEQRFSLMMHPAFCAGAVVSCLLLMFPAYAGWDSLRFWLATMAFVASLPAIFAATKNISLLNWLGDLSYPLYLVHYPIVLKVADWANTGGLLNSVGPCAFTSLALLMCICAAVALHYLLEKPAAGVLHRVIDRRVIALARQGRWGRRPGAEPTPSILSATSTRDQV